MLTCSSFLGLFVDLRPVSNYHHAPAQAWIAFAAIIGFGCTLSLANIGTSVAVERDWVSTISFKQPEDTLTRLNTYMRRIDLLCKLLAPLFVSLLTTTASYIFAVAFQMGLAAATLLFELFWIQVVFKYFPVLSVNVDCFPNLQGGEADSSLAEGAAIAAAVVDKKKPKSYDKFTAILADWKEFSRMPVFTASLAISMLYLTVLS